MYPSQTYVHTDLLTVTCSQIYSPQRAHESIHRNMLTNLCPRIYAHESIHRNMLTNLFTATCTGIYSPHESIHRNMLTNLFTHLQF